MKTLKKFISVALIFVVVLSMFTIMAVAAQYDASEYKEAIFGHSHDNIVNVLIPSKCPSGHTIMSMTTLGPSYVCPIHNDAPKTKYTFIPCNCTLTACPTCFDNTFRNQM
jgi:hypothetical protein